MTYAQQIEELTNQYNAEIRSLEREYEMTCDDGGFFTNLSTHSTRRDFSDRYDMLARDYREKCRQLLERQKLANPAWAKSRKLGGWGFVAGIVLLLAFCTNSLPIDEASPSALMTDTEQEQTYWNADNIKIPYLEDATQYVSNPDGVLSQPAVDRMNATLKLMDDSVDAQTIVIVVNHIENDDPFRMAQDVGNKYGVGRNDRGLVIVVGYEDHSINMSSGRSLEAELTDAECHQLEQRYVVPAMRAEMPDSGMIYLVEAVYSLLQSKQLPQMSTLVSLEDQKDEEILTTVALYMLLLGGWCVLFAFLNSKFHWVVASRLMGNPFMTSGSGGGFSGGFGGGFGGGGGFSGGGGGSFGGGSFGGGGATSRW